MLFTIKVPKVVRIRATWMIQHGAKNLIFASRSGLAKQSAQDVVEHLKNEGANVAVYSCDVSDKRQLSSMLTQCKNEMPPIRGVIQAAMVIQNSFFQNMSHESYMTSLAPKVSGTGNLHDCLPSDLDFFTLLSSTVGSIGNASQAGYAAASTFQDAFASFRLSRGLPCTSLDLGMISDIGYVAENTSVQQGLEKLGYEGINEAELMAMLHYSITNPLRDAKEANTITGLGTYRPSATDQLHPALAVNPRFSHFRRLGASLAPSESNAAVTKDATQDLRASLSSATSHTHAAGLLTSAIIEKMSALLLVPVEDISAGKPMVEYGMDSLVAVQMRAWLLQCTDVPVSILELISNKAVKVVAEGILKKCKIIDVLVTGEGTIG